MIIASNRRNPLHKATHGLFLFAVPFRGFYTKDLMDVEFPTDEENEFLSKLGSGDFLGNELYGFPDVVREIPTFTYLEKLETHGLIMDASGRPARRGHLRMAANPEEVSLGLPSEVERLIPVHRDHSDIVKFTSRSDEAYKHVRLHLIGLLQSLDGHQRPGGHRGRCAVTPFSLLYAAVS